MTLRKRSACARVSTRHVRGQVATTRTFWLSAVFGTALATFTIGYFTGRWSKTPDIENLRLEKIDAEVGAKAIDLQKDIVTLTVLRQGKGAEMIPELEYWV